MVPIAQKLLSTRLLVVILVFSLITLFSKFIYYSEGPLSVGNLRSSVLNINFGQKDLVKPSTPDLVWWQKFLCDRRKDTKEFQQRCTSSDVTLREFWPKESSRNVFLQETSCNTRPSPRQLCSVESWANRNPEYKIWYIWTSPYVDDSYGLLRRLMSRYPNVNVVSLDAEKMFTETPLAAVFFSHKWKENEDLAAQQLGNILRVVLLWRFGGFYSDTDVICLKNMANLTNVVGFQSGDKLNTAVLHGNAHHETYWKLMEHIGKNFKASVWGNNGPIAITETISSLCSVKDFNEARTKSKNETMNCSGLMLLPEKYFYPVPPPNNQYLFAEGQSKDFDENFKSSFTIHFWNKLTKEKKVKIGGQSIFEEAAKRSCPVTYEHVASVNAL